MSNHHSILTKTWVVCLLALVSCALWGSAFPCIKAGYTLFSVGGADTASQILFAGARFFLAGILTIIFGSIQGRRPLLIRKSAFHKVLILSLFQTILLYTLFYMSLARTTAINASIIDGTCFFFSILIAALIFRMEKFTSKKALGCILGFIGIVLVNLHGSTMQISFGIGDIFMLFSAVSSGLSTACLKIFSGKENPVMLSGYQFLIGGLIMTVIGFACGGRLHPIAPTAFLLLLYMALISSVAYTVWGILLRHNPVSRISVFGFMTPVFGVFFSAIFVGEHQNLGLFTILALILVCLGIWIVQKADSNKGARHLNTLKREGA